MTRRRRVPPPPDPYPKEEVFSKHGPEGDHGGEDIRGSDGRPIYPGVMVRRPAHYNAVHRHNIPEAWGRVRRLYRQPGVSNLATGCDIVVETTDSRYFWADTVRRSSREYGMNEAKPLRLKLENGENGRLASNRG